MKLLSSLVLFLVCASVEATLDHNQFNVMWTKFKSQAEQTTSTEEAEILKHEFKLIDEFGISQYPRRRSSIQGMDRDERWAPYVENKVTLRNGTEMSASRIDFKTPYHTFIASQAPFEHNVQLFWKMIWENHVDQIVMLTELFEEARGDLSHPYWPLKKGEPLQVSKGMEITLVDESWLLNHLKENIQLRTFEVHRKGQTRRIMHYWYHNWPDRTAPNQSETLTTLIKRVQKDKKTHAPILVHCAGGVGRSGVFIALYHMKERKDKKDTPLSLFDLVAYLRWQRPKMVAKPEQYEFCYRYLST